MKGINKVFLSGNVLENIEYGNVSNGAQACSFHVASDRHTSTGVITAFVRVNVYVEGLLRICKMKLVKGVYVLVEGELMNRDGQMGDLTEVRAREIIFMNKDKEAGGTT